MTGRRRQHKAKSPEAECTTSKNRNGEIKEVLLPRCTDFTEEKRNETSKTAKPKKMEKESRTEDNPKARKLAARTRTPKEETTKMQQETVEDATKAPVKTTKVRAGGGKAKVEVVLDKETKMQSEVLMEGKKRQTQMPKTTTAPPEKTTKAKKSASISPEELKETTKIQPETAENNKKAPTKSNKTRARCGKAQFEEQTQSDDATNAAEKTAKAEASAEKPEDTTKGMVEDRHAVHNTLRTTLEKLKIKKNDKVNTSKVINEIRKIIVEHLKKHSQHFKEVETPLNTGSYYENVKISNPDEFDVMFPMPVERVDIQPFGDEGAFYKVAMKRGNNPLNDFQENDTLSASKMLEEFRKEVKKSVKESKEWQVTKKERGCPAVTLTTQVQSVPISLDVVLCLMVKSSWPNFTNDGFQIERWLGGKVKQQYKWKPYYLVPKYKGRGTEEKDGVLAKDAWRISFSHIEKDILRNHGSEKTCCEKDGASCCRKDCLKLLKHLLHLLKEKNSSFDKFCSYHAKTALFHACSSRTKDSDWSASNLSHCFQQLLKDFENYLLNGRLFNFFIPSQNLLSGCSQKMCKSLADSIKEQREKGFPIFK
ncbi:cyclic GMP-AMP synthase-like [Mugil cephalus]|uniref:cyclic GMP-AMP synthase-like n=1 Tax=Mugil cephalus TaxID=48193 RepID=UPI001FB76692|nr:cyclic GMP-AMP synthase-like [Mugil cephalus]